MGSATYRFGRFGLNPSLGELCHDGRSVRIEPRALALLCYLVEHRDRIVAKKELLDAVWGGGFVTEAALTTGLRTARLAIGDTGREQGFIRTVHGRGYQFIAPTTVSPTGSVTADVPETTVAPITTVAAGTAAGSRDDIRFCRTTDGTRIVWAATGSGPPLVKTANWLSRIDLERSTTPRGVLRLRRPALSDPPSPGPPRRSGRGLRAGPR